MRGILITSHNPRHIYVAEQLSKIFKNFLIISVTMGNNPALTNDHGESNDDLIQWFNDRYNFENIFFKKKYFEIINSCLLPIRRKDLNSNLVENTIIDFNADIIVVFGTDIIKSNIINVSQNIINFHLGLSPYYNGAGTTWWPMFEGKFEKLGTTIHYLDEGVDTGKIISQTKADIKIDDNPHQIGFKNIITGTEELLKVCNALYSGEKIEGITQWKVENKQYFMKDFNEKSLKEFKHRWDDKRILENWFYGKKERVKMVRLINGKSTIVYE